MMGDFGLGLRLAVGGSRSSGASLLRLAMTTIGIALVVAVLLPAASIGSAVNSRAERAAGAKPSHTAVPGVDPLYDRQWYAKPHGEYVSVHAIAPEGPTAPIPPGLSRLPGPGELVVSPAVAEQLNSPDGEAYRARLTGKVIGVIDKPGLTDANDLTVWQTAPVGDLRSDPLTEAIYGFGSPVSGFSVNASLLAILLPVVVALLLPLLVFVTTASRMGAAQRDRRLAALRLIGVDARQIHRVAAAESLLGAIAGLVVGIVLFLVLRPWLGSLDMFGIQVFAEDFSPPWPMVVLIVLLVPALAVGAALFGLRNTIVEPLGVVRQGRQSRRRMGWRWTITGVGAALLAFSSSAGRNADDSVLIALTAGSAMLLIGVAVLLPWVVERVANRLHGGPPSWQFAVSRLQVDSGTSSRVVSGLVVVLAGAIMIQVLLSSTLTERADRFTTAALSLPSAPVAVQTNGQRQDEVLAKIKPVPGIDRAEALQTVYGRYTGGPLTDQSVQIEIGSCAALALRANLGSCTDGDVFVVDTPQASGQVSLLRSGRSNGASWTVPSNVRPLKADQAIKGTEMLATTGAFKGVQLPGDRVDVLVGGQGTDEELSDRVSAAVSSLTWQAVVSPADLQSASPSDNAAMDRFRAALLAASIFVLMVAALSLLILSVEQITERRRALAALSAAGVPLGVLARTSLWQTGLPMAIGIVLAVGAGIGLSAPMLGVAGISLTINPGVIAGLVGAAALAVLVVTACTLPLLRQATRVESLRAE